MSLDKKALALYAVTDRRWLNGASLSEKVREAIKGGASLIQLREKEMPVDDFIREAEEIKKVCGEYGVPLIINDNADVALAVEADGVHVGQEDLSAASLRSILGEKAIIGVSAATPEQARLAQEQGADYLGVGAVFETGSKDDADKVSVETLTDICNDVDIPVVAIGGITEGNIKDLSGTGIAGVAVISAVFAQDDIERASAKLRETIKETLKV